MENQHRKIKGYRELTQEEIDLMNEIKEHGAKLGELCAKLEAYISADNEENGTPGADSRRWLSIGRTHMQQGVMALTRAVAKPEFF